MRVNAEEGFRFIFIRVLFFSASCSEGFLVAAIDLNRQGGSGEPPYQFYLSEFWGFLFVLGLGFVQRGPYSEVRGYRSLHG